MFATRIKCIAVLMGLCTGLAFGASDNQWNLEQEKQRLMREVQETQARIGQMRVEALEHEAVAKQLAAEAAGLELQMHQALERRKRDLELADTEIKVDQMFGEVEQLEKHGHHDEARALHAKAEGMAERLRAQRMEQAERDEHQMELEIDELRERSNQAEREGRIEEAQHLWKQADRLLENLRGHLEHREQRTHMAHMHARLSELGRAMEEARRQGQESTVEELREAAEGLERKIHERERAVEMDRVERESHRLHTNAEEAEIQGRGDEADTRRHEAKHMEHRLGDIAGDRHDEEDWDRDEDEEEDDDEIESLRDEMNDLREQMAHMRELMEAILHRLK